MVLAGYIWPARCCRVLFEAPLLLHRMWVEANQRDRERRSGEREGGRRFWDVQLHPLQVRRSPKKRVCSFPCFDVVDA